LTASLLFHMEIIIQQAVQLYEDAVAALERGDFARSDELHLECIAQFQQVNGPTLVITHK
jgi:hypothetical protein